jgi:hypothetical protein
MPPKNPGLGQEMMAAGLDALRADLLHQGKQIAALTEELERHRLKIAMLTGRLEAEASTRLGAPEAREQRTITKVASASAGDGDRVVSS